MSFTSNNTCPHVQKKKKKKKKQESLTCFSCRTTPAIVSGITPKKKKPLHKQMQMASIKYTTKLMANIDELRCHLVKHPATI